VPADRARRRGHRVSVHRRPNPDEPDRLATVDLLPDPPADADLGLANAIVRRRTDPGWCRLCTTSPRPLLLARWFRCRAHVPTAAAEADQPGACLGSFADSCKDRVASVHDPAQAAWPPMSVTST
jgi:hypothetical protein